MLNWIRIFVWIATSLGLLGTVQAHTAESVSGLNTRYRQGQTFITWKENGAAVYRIYRHTAKITSNNLPQAEFIAQYGKDSGAYLHEKKARILAKKTGTAGYNQRYIIEDNGEALPAGIGLCVITVRQDGSSFYAVEAGAKGMKGGEGALTALDKSVEEKKAVPGAVMVWKNKAGTGFCYTHWMDPRDWNPRIQQGYAYNFGVAAPQGYDGKAPLPAILRLHGMSGDYALPDTCNKYWVGLNVHPGDKAGSWFFGFQDRTGKKIVNYTERRIVLIARWLMAGYPNQPFKVNENRIYVGGNSMGGTGTHALTARYGDLFAGGMASKGAVNHRLNGKWARQVARHLGPQNEKLPVEKGISAWDWQDYGWWHLKHIKQETGFISHANGTVDRSIPWKQMPAYFDALQKAKRPFMAGWKKVGHSGGYYCSTKSFGLNRFNILKNESLPAFAHASNSNNPHKTMQGQINQKLEWGCTLYDFAKGEKADDIQDEEKTYGICLRALKGAATADVTPRRLQKFKPVAGEEIEWKALDYTDPKNPKPIAQGTVKTDEFGLVTVTKVKILSRGWGTRLLLKRK